MLENNNDNEFEEEGILFREHKTLFKDSMRTMVRIDNIYDLKVLLRKLDYPYSRMINHIRFVYDGFDFRNQWETYEVQVKYVNSKKYVSKGMSNKIFKNTKL